MNDENLEVSESEKFMIKYNELLQIVKQNVKVSNAHLVDLSKSKLSRLYNGQFDPNTLIELASIIGYDVQFSFCKRR